MPSIALLIPWASVSHWFIIVVSTILSACAWFALQETTAPTRQTINQVTRRAFSLTLVVTWLPSALLTSSYFLVKGKTEGVTDDAYLSGLGLVALNVGGFIGLFRTIKARMEVRAGLRDQVSTRVSLLSVPIIEDSVRARTAASMEELAVITSRMLALAVSLPLVPRPLDRAVLWFRDETQQRWCTFAASDGLNMGRTQPIAPLNGRGIIARFASEPAPKHVHCWATTDEVRKAESHVRVFLCRKDLQNHPWYLDHGDQRRRSAGLALVIIETELDGTPYPIGALSLTTLDDDEIPLEGTDRAELVDILGFWAQSFAVPVARLRDSSLQDLEEYANNETES